MKRQNKKFQFYFFLFNNRAWRKNKKCKEIFTMCVIGVKVYIIASYYI